MLCNALLSCNSLSVNVNITPYAGPIFIRLFIPLQPERGVIYKNCVASVRASHSVNAMHRIDFLQTWDMSMSLV